MAITGSVAAVSSIASVGLSAYSAVEKGAGQKASDDYQAQRAEQAAQYGELKASQTDAQTRENLNVTLANISAVRAASGVDPSSPTSAVLRDQTERLGDRARGIQVGNILEQSTQDTQDAAYLRNAGDFAMSMGEVNAATGVAGSVSKWATAS